ncbi:hypothetical protein CRM22_000527 [Opisthorchis felineus]|uniref:C3H1-type domain-containing protein n=1 Tax=Opisthorchis felineus TaxID=147828 RepID=A0A4S2MEY5_OPIFE|nr:hypothetical protein CRM22_000527 [Opisthorchis felineus]
MNAPVPTSSSSFYIATQSSLNEVNLEDVPMDIVTSDGESEEYTEDPPSDYANLLSEVLNRPLFDVVSGDVSSLSHQVSFTLPKNSADLDEMELRSRALRSLLLQRHSPTKDGHPISSCSDNAVTNASSSAASLVTKTLFIGSGKHLSQRVTQNRFVITVSDTSDSDTPDDYPPVRRVVQDTGNPDTSHDVVLLPERLSSAPTTASPTMVVTTAFGTTGTTVTTDSTDTITRATYPITSTVTSSVSETTPATLPVAKRSPTTEIAQGGLLQRKMELLRLTLTVKRQQRIVEERRQLTNKLFRTCSELRARMKTTRKLYKQAYNSLQQASLAQHSYQRQLLSAQRRYAHECNNLRLGAKDNFPNQTKKLSAAPEKCKLISAASVESMALLRMRLMPAFLKILQYIKVTTPYFTFYRLDIPLASKMPVWNSPCTLLTSEHMTNHVLLGQSSSPRNSSCAVNIVTRVDPNVPLCPFSLDGECKDTECTLQHPPNVLDKLPFIPSSTLRDKETVSTTSQASPSVSEGEESCPVCKKTLSTSTIDVVEPTLRRWHALYLGYKRSIATGVLTDFSKVCSTSLDLLRQSADNSEIVDHHLALVHSKTAGSKTIDIVECLKASDYSLAACRSVFRSPLLSGMVRRLIARSALETLLLQINRAPHTEDFTSALSTSFICLAYHLSWLLSESCTIDLAYSLLDKLLKDVNKEHPVRYGLWWLKLLLTLDQRIPPEDTLFSLLNFPNFTKRTVAQCQALIEEAVSDLGIPKTAAALEDIPAFTGESCLLKTSYLALVYLYLQTLCVKRQYQTAGELCLRFSVLDFLQEFDDLFFPTAIYVLHVSDASLDWPSLLKKVPESLRPTLTISFRIEFSFLLANLACRKKSLDIARSLLLESLAGLTFLPSDADSDVLKTFEELLGVNAAEYEPLVLSELLSFRGRTYLWLSYCLYSLLCSTNTAVPLKYLMEYFQKQQTTETPTEDRATFDRLLLHMIVTLANGLLTSDMASDYSQCLSTIFLDRPFAPYGHVPSWFIELIQRINLTQFSSPGVRQDLCVRLVETYGSHLVPPLCRTLFAMGDHFLAQSLCAIGRLDKPCQEDFWLLSAALLFSESDKTTTPTASRQRIVRLHELFSDAISAVPSSSVLWKYCALATKAVGTGTALLLKRAGEFGMLDAISEFVKEEELMITPARFASRSDPSLHETTPLSGKKRKKGSRRTSLCIKQSQRS